MAKPIVNQQTCIGCGTCESLCSAVFKVDDSGKAQIQGIDFEANKDCIKQAIDSCPVNAISLE